MDQHSDAVGGADDAPVPGGEMEKTERRMGENIGSSPTDLSLVLVFPFLCASIVPIVFGSICALH